MVSNSKKHIVIVGGGLAGWLSVVRFQALAKDLNYTISIVEPTDSKVLTTGEACIQRVANFLRRNGAIPDEKKFFKASNSVLKLGTALKGWHNVEYYSVLDASSSAKGYHVDRNLLYQYWLQHLKEEFYEESFSIDYYAYKHRKTYFDHEGNDLLGSVLSHEDDRSFGYHIDIKKTVDYLRKWAIDKGVNIIHNEFTGVIMKDQLIDRLILKDGQEIKGDLFLDCTGVNSYLLNEAYGNEVKSKFLEEMGMELCNSAVYTVRERQQEELQLMTDAYHQPHGWIWDIPLYQTISSGYVYHSDFASKEQIEQALSEFTGMHQNMSFQHISWKPKYLKNPFIGNCVAMGIGAGFADPLEATTSIMLVDQLERKELVTILNVDINNHKIKQTYNQKAVKNFLAWYSLIEFHYYNSTKHNSDFWRSILHKKRKLEYDRQRKNFIHQEFPNVYIGWAMEGINKQHRQSLYGQLGIRQKNQIPKEYFERSKGDFRQLIALKNTIKKEIDLKGISHKQYIDLMNA